MPAPDHAITILRARYVAPMNRPVMPDGAVAIRQGRIITACPFAEIRSSMNGAIVEDLGDQILLPGLVNAHTHLELSDIARPTEMTGLVPWLAKIVAAATRRSGPERALEIGIAQSLRFGVTSVGDITREPSVARPILRAGGLRAVSFGEIAAAGERRVLLEERLAAATDGASDDFLRIGISPHATYSVEPAGYARCLAEARSRQMPLATHVAESPDEATFLAEHTGPFRDIWRRLGGWDDAIPRFAGGPIRLLASLGVLAYPVLLAHVNYCDDAELAVLAAGKASVVYCPRTHAYFQHAPHRWRDMLAAGINVAVGTDSAASSGDVNLLDDLRLLHHIAPEVSVEQLWQMATMRGAKALMWEKEIGSLEPGKWADMIAFDAASADPLRAILESNAMPRKVWVAGDAKSNSPHRSLKDAPGHLPPVE